MRKRRGLLLLLLFFFLKKKKRKKRRGLLETKTKRSILEEGDIGREELEKGKR